MSGLCERIWLCVATLGIGAGSAFAGGQVELQKITASDAAVNDLFGVAMSIDGDIAVAGTFFDDDAGTDSGSAYVFYRNQGGPESWGQVKKLTASDGAAGDNFGRSVAVSGDIVVVGANADDTSGANSGSAYVFYRNHGGTDNWGQVQKLTASDAASSDEFGISVAVSGDTVAVGAFLDASPATNAGSAYVFYRNQGGVDNWGQVMKLTASDQAAADSFGYALTLSGEIAVVGAYSADNAGVNSGSAYVFYRDQGGLDNWGHVKELRASDGAAFDEFGIVVAISGEVAVVGAWGDDDAGSNSGSAYVFARNEGGPDNWGQVKKITASDAAADDKFGESVSVSGDIALVSARLDDDAGVDAGAAYAFARNEGGTDNWGQLVKLIASDGAANDQLGVAVSVSGDIAVVGAFLDDSPATDAGSAYVYEISSVPGTFSLTGPAPGEYVTTTTPMLSWSASLLADSYSLVIDDDADLSSPLLTQTGLVATSFNVPPGTLAPGVVYWQVLAVNEDGSTTGSPDPADFAVLNPDCPSDTDGNGAVDVVDLLGLLGTWGPCPEGKP